MKPSGPQIPREDEVEFVTVEYHQSISCRAKFLGFSHEELRYADYLRGYRPRPRNQRHIIGPDPPTSHQQLDFLRVEEGPRDSFIYMVMSLVPGYDQHSLEELRLACYQTGRQLTSTEIIERAKVGP